MGKTILSHRQQLLLQKLSELPAVTDSFYLSGGTALAEYYLHHRYSEDLDFFSECEVDVQGIFTVLSSVKKIMGFQLFNGLDPEIILTCIAYSNNKVGRLMIS